MKHTNICFTADFAYSDNEYTKPYCISGGFDYNLITWDIEKS